METTRFYSQRTIAIATFLGGPLAAGILVKKNFQNMGKDSQGTFAFWVGVSATVLLFSFIFLMPSSAIEKLNAAILPAFYSAVIFIVVEKVQGKELKAHEENRGIFYSGWKAAGVGSVCLVITLAGVVAISFFASDDFDADAYDKGIAEVQQYEGEALQLFQLVESAQDDKILTFVREQGIPGWNKCIHVLDRLDGIDNLPAELHERNQLIKNYLNLRLKSYLLIEKALVEQTSAYDGDILQLNDQLNEIMEDL